MKKSHLRACTSCARHVRVSEAACPFCGVTLGPSFGAAPAPLPPSARLSRAALVAFGTGTISIAAACGGAVAGSSGPIGDAGRDTGMSAAPDGGEEQDSGLSIAPPYGQGVFDFDSGTTEQKPADAATDSPLIAVPYGVPPGH
ncbi:MAG: hypothetical protein ACLQVI_26865 [Polyangiaceae bacterium]